MKIKPVLDALDARDVMTTLIHTGQHYDPALSEVFFSDLNLREPEFHLGAGSGSQAAQTAAVMIAFEPLLEELQPDVVVTVGDVNSTLACSLVAAKHGALLAHVEAGLRSRDWTMPEEVNRVVADRLSDFLFAPSKDAVENLQREGFRAEQIHLVGNVMVDTLLRTLPRAQSSDLLDRFDLKPGGYGLVTLHRPSNVDDPHILQRFIAALREVSSVLPLIFPAHPRTRSRLVGEKETGHNLRVIEPLGYLDFLGLEASARLVLTDSGGVQEETTVLGVPCLTLRDSTERPITVTEGTNRVVGTDPDRIIAAVQETLSRPPAGRRPMLWDGKAGERIADVLTSIDLNDWKRPTES